MRGMYWDDAESVRDVGFGHVRFGRVVLDLSNGVLDILILDSGVPFRYVVIYGRFVIWVRQVVQQAIVSRCGLFP